MELHDFAEQVLFATILDDKLQSPAVVTDERRIPAAHAPGSRTTGRVALQTARLRQGGLPQRTSSRSGARTGTSAALLCQPRGARHRVDGAGAPALSGRARRLSPWRLADSQGRAASYPPLHAAHAAMRDSVRRASRQWLLLALRGPDGEPARLRRRAVSDLRAGEPRLLPLFRSRVSSGGGRRHGRFARPDLPR